MSRYEDDDEVDVEADLIRETNLAFLISDEYGTKCWVPKSLTTYNPMLGIFTMPRWLAEREALI